MSVGSVIIWVLVAIVVICGFLAVLRFLTLRSHGAVVLLRKLPAKDYHGWRHGILRYRGKVVEFFKLRSVSPSADATFNQLSIDILNTRPVTDDESGFIPEGYTALKFIADGVEYELALTKHALMAFGAWVEASPSRRQERIDFRSLRDKAERPRGNSSPFGPSMWTS